MNAWPVLRGATLADVQAAGPDLDRRAERLAAQRRAHARPLKPRVRRRKGTDRVHGLQI
jgi:hypothetical protein